MTKHAITLPLRLLLLLGCAVAAGGCSENGAPPQTGRAGKDADAGRPPRTLPLPASESDALPPGHPPVDASAAMRAESGAADEARSSALAWDPPAGWVAQPPSSGMRHTQYRVPGSGGDAECVVFYFGPGQGGAATANVERWAGQFQQPDGRPSHEVMKTREFEVGAIDVLTVEITGTYDGGMASPQAGPKPGSMLLGAIAAGPDANWFFKLIGPEATVREQRQAFERLLSTLR
jgi:hypothetical protein